jgi:hypothetical protein
MKFNQLILVAVLMSSADMAHGHQAAASSHPKH